MSRLLVLHTAVLLLLVNSGFASEPLLSTAPAQTVVCNMRLSPLDGNSSQVFSLLSVALGGQNVTLPTMIELANTESARFLATARPGLRSATLTFQTDKLDLRSGFAKVRLPAIFTFSIRDQSLSWPVLVVYEQ